MSEATHGPVESFSAEEREALAPYFTNLDRPVFALINLPEVVKGALFARYSRSAKSLRRLFLDPEFYRDEIVGARVLPRRLALGPPIDSPIGHSPPAEADVARPG